MLAALLAGAALPAMAGPFFFDRRANQSTGKRVRA